MKQVYTFAKYVSSWIWSQDNEIAYLHGYRLVYLGSRSTSTEGSFDKLPTAHYDFLK